jgi:AraC-like DNA-binding protein
MFVQNLNKRKPSSTNLIRANETRKRILKQLPRKLSHTKKQLYSEKAARLHIETKLENPQYLLQATLESISDGVIAINSKGQIINFNQKFVQMWQIPDSIMTSHNHNQCLIFYKNLLKDPETFSIRVQELDIQANIESYYILELKDNRIFELYTQPLQLGEQIIGTVWSFRDITVRERYIAKSQQATTPSSADTSLSTDINPQLKEVLNFIEANYHQSISLSDVAQAVGYAPAYLTDLMRRQTGKTVHQWIVECRMTQACSLLLNTNQSIEQIAEAVGYKYTGCFFRQFRISFEMTPQAWRNLHRVSCD